MKKGERTFDLVLLALSLAFLAASLQITPLSQLSLESDGAYPIFISCLSLVIAVYILVSQRKNGGEAKEGTPFHPDVLVMILLMALYFAAIMLVHYILATLLFTVLAITYLDRRRWHGLLIGFTATFWIVLIFKYFFRVILP